MEKIVHHSISGIISGAGFFSINSLFNSLFTSPVYPNDWKLRPRNLENQKTLEQQKKCSNY